MQNELTPDVVKAIARGLGYVTNGQASTIKEACEHYIAGKSVNESVLEVTGECNHNWVKTGHGFFLSEYECVICGDTKSES